MIELIPTDSQANFIEFSNQLLIDSFPACERPSIEDLAMRNSSFFHACTITHDGLAVGLFNHWQFPSFHYIEHFAISPALRNAGIGSQTLTSFLKGNALPTILEAELPNDTIAQHRLAFYQRNGFVINPQQYIQPAYSPNGESLPMHILSTQKLDDTTFEKIRHTLYKYVYKQNKDKLEL